ncbi:MAG: phosphoribosylanthranilate isomerase [Betaproteobacteria bacterium]|nr:phosphoribosylanthranilate isomerase [Betaproteobacteria bacterium]
MHRTRVKICGITRAEDAVAAAKSGADAIGMVFYTASPRAVEVAQAKTICAALPPFVSTVALFVNAPAGQVHEVVTAVRPDLLQFHGDEDAQYCSQFTVPYMKALRVGSSAAPADLLKWQAEFQSARMLLLDTLASGVYGGSGESFNWQVIPPEMRQRIVLSGGLQPANVAEAVREVRPWAVDVSSGVEMHKGIKDHRRIEQFIEAVRNADAD